MEESKLIIPIVNNSDHEFIFDLKNYFNKADVEIAILVDKSVKIDIRKKFPSDWEIITQHQNHSPKKKLEYYLKKFKIDNIKEVVSTEVVYDHGTPRHYFRHRSGRPDYDEYYKKAHRLLSFLHQYYENGDGGYPVQNIGGRIIRIVLRNVSEYYEYHNIWTGFSPINNKIAIIENECGEWKTFNPAYELEMDRSDKEDAKEFVERYIGESRRIDKKDNSPEPEKNPAKYDQIFKNIMRKIIKLLESDRKKHISDYLQWKRKNIENIIRKKANKRYYLDKDHVDLSSKDYILYPIQYPKESRITLRGKPYLKQAWLIEYLSRAAPKGYTIVVKPHPHWPYILSAEKVRYLSQFVDFIPPEMDTHNLIEYSSLVVVINNTVGFESLLHGKPVMTLGNAFYDGCGYTIDIEDITKMPNSLLNNVDSDGLSEKEVLEVAYRTLKGSSPGVWNSSQEKNQADFVSTILSELNNN